MVSKIILSNASRSGLNLSQASEKPRSNAQWKRPDTEAHKNTTPHRFASKGPEGCGRPGVARSSDKGIFALPGPLSEAEDFTPRQSRTVSPIFSEASDCTSLIHDHLSKEEENASKTEKDIWDKKYNIAGIRQGLQTAKAERNLFKTAILGEGPKVTALKGELSRAEESLSSLAMNLSFQRSKLESLEAMLTDREPGRPMTSFLGEDADFRPLPGGDVRRNPAGTEMSWSGDVHTLRQVRIPDAFDTGVTPHDRVATIRTHLQGQRADQTKTLIRVDIPVVPGSVDGSPRRVDALEKKVALARSEIKNIKDDNEKIETYIKSNIRRIDDLMVELHFQQNRTPLLRLILRILGNGEIKSLKNQIEMAETQLRNDIAVFERNVRRAEGLNVDLASVSPSAP